MCAVRKFIIVDDDPINNEICRMALKRALGDVEIKVFTEPEEGLEFIEREYSKDQKPTVLFLDINMPSLTGWEFMEEYNNFSDKVKKWITVYMVTSSIDERDKDKATLIKTIKGFISKPVDVELILALSDIRKK